MLLYTQQQTPNRIDMLNVRKHAPRYTLKYNNARPNHKKHIVNNSGVYEHSKTLAMHYYNNKAQNQTQTSYIIIDNDIIKLDKYIKYLKHNKIQFKIYQMHDNNNTLINYIATNEGITTMIYHATLRHMEYVLKQMA